MDIQILYIIYTHIQHTILTTITKELNLNNTVYSNIQTESSLTSFPQNVSDCLHDDHKG